MGSELIRYGAKSRVRVLWEPSQKGFVFEAPHPYSFTIPGVLITGGVSGFPSVSRIVTSPSMTMEPLGLMVILTGESGTRDTLESLRGADVADAGVFGNLELTGVSPKSCGDAVLRHHCLRHPIAKVVAGPLRENAAEGKS